MDIIEIYRDGILIAKRTEKSDREIEIEKLENEMRELAGKQKEIEMKIEKLKFKDSIKKVIGCFY